MLEADTAISDLTLMILFLAAFLLWALTHSVTASNWFKQWIRSFAGEQFYQGWYRAIYNLLSVISIFPIFVIGSLLLPNAVVWQISQPWAFAFYVVQGFALIGLAISLWQTGIMRFLGLSQVFRYLEGSRKMPAQPLLVTTGVYRRVRHPLYFFTLLLIWFFPMMTLQLLLFNLASTVYFLVGSIHEERRLLSQFGDQYESYRKSTPRIIPLKLK